MSAIPSACQPSKNSGTCSTHWRYFSIAAGNSPIARSPLASSKSSSICDGGSSIRLSGPWSIGERRPRYTIYDTKHYLPGRSLAEDRRAPGPLLFKLQPLADCDCFVSVILLRVFGLFVLVVFLLIDRLFVEHVDDQPAIPVLQEFRSPTLSKINAVGCHDGGDFYVATGICGSKWWRSFRLVAGLFCSLHEIRSVVHLRVDLFSNFFRFCLDGISDLLRFDSRYDLVFRFLQRKRPAGFDLRQFHNIKTVLSFNDVAHRILCGEVERLANQSGFLSDRFVRLLQREELGLLNLETSFLRCPVKRRRILHNGLSERICLLRKRLLCRNLLGFR